MSRRKSKNSWFGEPRRHAAAARLGWSHRSKRGRRKHRNAGAVTLSHPIEAAKSGFDVDLLKQGGWIIGGNMATTWAADQILNRVDMLKKNTVARVGTILLTAGLVAAGTKKFAPARANDVLLGGMLSGLTRGLREVFPSQFGDLRDDLDGMEGIDGVDDYVDPRQIATARNGINDYVDPRQIMTARNGINDYADFRQIQAPVKLDGMQESAVAEEISMQSL